MNINEIVCSLDMGQKIKAAGWTKPTMFEWLNNDGEFMPMSSEEKGFFRKDEIFPAPTAEEILRELPRQVHKPKGHRLYKLYVVKCVRNNGVEGWEVYWRDKCGFGNIHNTNEATLSEAAAQMYCWLAEKGYIKTEGAK